jgi:hypothetical protein
MASRPGIDYVYIGRWTRSDQPEKLGGPGLAFEGFHTDNYNEPEGGFKDCAFPKYVLEA